MSEDKRYTIKSQDDYFGITDNYDFDKVNIINGIRTKIEAEWLCDEMNELNDENEELRKENIQLEEDLEYYKVKYNDLNEKDIEMKRKAQKEYCAEKLPNFAEFGTDAKGNCLMCGKNIWEHISLEKANNELITGCPTCHRTYCG